jgi:hypothetical protein
MATRTIGSGGNHADVNAWVAYLQGIDPFSAIQEGLVVASGLTVSATQDISGFDENGNGWVLRANTGASFRDHASAATNPQFYDSTKGAFIEKTSGQPAVIDASVTNGTIKDLQIKKNDDGYNEVINISNSGNTVNLDSLIVHLATGARAIVQRKGDIRRTLVVCDEGDGVMLSSGGGTVDRLTLRRLNGAGGTGLSRDYGTWTLTNVAAAGWSTDATGTFTSSFCATDLATGGFGATGRQNNLVAATEWESATADFRVKSTSAKLKDNGTGSSADIIGQAASGTVDIGQWEFQAGGGGTEYTLTADAASYSLTGIATALKAARKLVAAQATYTLTGVATGLKAGRKLAAAQATFSLTGIATGLKAARKLTAAQATYALTGIDATLTYSGDVSGYTLTADTAAYTLTGITTALKVARKFAAAQATFTLTGQAATFPRGRRLTAASGAYTLTGIATGLKRTYALQAETAPYLLSGITVTLTYSNERIWLPVTPAAAVWADATPDGSTWTPVSPASGTWTEQ